MWRPQHVLTLTLAAFVAGRQPDRSHELGRLSDIAHGIKRAVHGSKAPVAAAPHGSLHGRPKSSVKAAAVGYPPSNGTCQMHSACARCKAASGGSCRSTFGWDWKVSPAANDAKTKLPGMRMVRSIAAIREPGVRTVALWNQSNWPALTQTEPVRAASAADRDRLCALWDSEHTYQAWTVIMGCPGKAATEYEPACANQAAVVEIPCARIDLTGDRTITGGIWDEDRWFRVSHSVHPPAVCALRPAAQVRSGPVALAISVYPHALGHFVPEQLPNIILLHAHLPPEVPIMVPDAAVPRKYLAPLLDSGVIPPGRLLFVPLRADGTVVKADSVYTVVNSHYSNVMSGDASLQLTRAAYAPRGPPPLSARTHILLVDRGRGARSMSNLAAVQGALREVVAEWGRTLGPAATALRIVQWRPLANLTADIDAWAHAALVVAPHGAGLSNMYFAAEGTPVIEVCYDDFGKVGRGMACPAMYATMASNLGLPYWVTTGRGGYSTPMEVDLVQLKAAAAHALRRAYSGGGGRGGDAAAGRRGRGNKKAGAGARRQCGAHTN